MTRFSTQMEATVKVPQEGFSLDDLKAHLRASKIPVDARLVPTTVKEVDPSDLYDSQFTPSEPVPERTEIGFIAKWTP
jgi:hypothetical protein